MQLMMDILNNIKIQINNTTYMASSTSSYSVVIIINWILKLTYTIMKTILHTLLSYYNINYI